MFQQRRFSIAVVLVLLTTATVLIYRHFFPNVIHGVIVCGRILKDGKPVADEKAQLFTWVGGHRYVLENGSLVDGGTSDLTRSLRPIETDSSGNFCLDSTPLKYFYKLSEFQVASMQWVPLPAHPKPTPGPYERKPAPPIPTNGVEGVIIEGEMLQEAQDLKLKAVFELAPPHHISSASGASGTYQTLFNNEKRLH